MNTSKDDKSVQKYSRSKQVNSVWRQPALICCLHLSGSILRSHICPFLSFSFCFSQSQLYKNNISNFKGKALLHSTAFSTINNRHEEWISKNKRKTQLHICLECLKSELCGCLFEEYSLVFLILCVGFLSKPCFLLFQNYFGSVTENTLVTQKAGGNQFPTSYRLSKISWVLGFFHKSRGLEGGSRNKKENKERKINPKSWTYVTNKQNQTFWCLMSNVGS